MKTAIVVTQPDGQIVRLPADVRLEGSEVFVKQVGQSVVLVPKQANPCGTVGRRRERGQGSRTTGEGKRGHSEQT